ncbi:MAG TPA: ATP-binding protein [Stellaceae bacterium]|jgi:two-component system osmolarity sensor histidine kinase EnvZ|nr:ATP-binding protein [Stellaceae bacterium]
MPSNLSDDALAEPVILPAVAANRTGGFEEPPPEALDIRQHGRFKRLLPQTMFGRSLLLIVAPLVLAQIFATWVFYARHWETVSRRLSFDVAGDIGMLIEAMHFADSELELTRLLENASGLTGINFSVAPDAALPPATPPGWSLFEEQLRLALAERVRKPSRIDASSDPRDIRIQIQLPNGVLAADVPRKRLYTSTTYIFILWMVGSSLVLLSVAALFLRNQVRSLRRLATAAERFGKGRPAIFTKIEGALEVRQAGAAFMQMRDRIQRQIRQRTEMLAGVSHDLRTPLTRMKLALELIPGDAVTEGLKTDVLEMERLVNLYLDFARGEGTEMPVDTDIAALIEELAASARRDGTVLDLDQPADLIVPVRPHALRRCLGNLIANARRYGQHVWLSSKRVEDGVDILIDDDGPGVPVAERDRVFQPFVRLDASRNPATGGIGLGLTIARDVARSHGGDVRLEASPHGGLRARVHLPR